MKKIILSLLLLILFTLNLSAQLYVTESGVLEKVAAPHFGQNVSEERFALITESQTFYLLNNGYWVNPNNDFLVMNYDTVAVNTQIEITGNMFFKKDENGAQIAAIDADRLNQDTTIWGGTFLSSIEYGENGSTEAYAVGFSNFEPICFLSYNGELLTQPMIFGDSIINTEAFFVSNFRTVIGRMETWNDNNGNPFQVIDLQYIIPRPTFTRNVEVARIPTPNLDTEIPVNTLAINIDGENCFLTFNGEFYDDENYNDGDIIDVKGVIETRYDIYGAAFKVCDFIEINKMNTQQIEGQLVETANPAQTSPPLPGTSMAIANEYEYHIANEYDPYEYQYVIIGNDTIYVEEDVLVEGNISTYMDIHKEVYYRVLITSVNSHEMTEKNPVTILSAENDGNDVITVSWNYPEGYVPTERATLSWTNGDMNDIVGASPTQWNAAHRYESSDLTDYVGWKLKKIAFVPIYNDDICDYYLRVWEGSINNTDLLMNQSVKDYSIEKWNYIELKNGII